MSKTNKKITYETNNKRPNMIWLSKIKNLSFLCRNILQSQTPNGILIEFIQSI